MCFINLRDARASHGIHFIVFLTHYGSQHVKTSLFQVKNPQYAELHTNLSLGWASHLPENEINYQLFPLTAPSFELNLKNSAVS